MVKKLSGWLLLVVGSVLLLLILVMVALSSYYNGWLILLSQPALWRNIAMVIVGALSIWGGIALLRGKEDKEWQKT